MERLGVEYDRWQRDTLDDWLAIEEDGTYVHFRNGEEVPRQNGKTAVIEGRIIPGAVLKRESFLFTAHEYATVIRLFDRLQHFFGERANDPYAKFPDLNRLVLSVRKAIGKEAIFLKNGATIYLSTRTKSAKLGFTVDVFIADEAQELTDQQSKAILSTVSAAPLGNPQYIFCGTPPTPESAGDVFASIRVRARAGQTDDLSWREWSVDDLEGVCDPDTWYRVNPAMGKRLQESAVRGELGTYTDPLSFAQMRLGYFLPEREERIEHVLEAEEWDACVVDPPATGEPFVAMKVTDSMGAVAVCLKPDTDVAPMYVELVAMRPTYGLAWLEEFALSVRLGARRLVIDGGAKAEELYNRLVAAGYPPAKIRLMRPADAATAFEGFALAVRELRVSHMGQTPLARSATRTAKRRVGAKGCGFASTEEADAEPVEAAAIAYWIAGITKRDQGGGDLWVW